MAAVALVMVATAVPAEKSNREPVERSAIELFHRARPLFCYFLWSASFSGGLAAGQSDTRRKAAFARQRPGLRNTRPRRRTALLASPLQRFQEIQVHISA